MIKKTLYFGNPAYLSTRLKQIVIQSAEKSKCDDSHNEEDTITRPIEDIGVLILDNKQITVTQGLLDELLENNCAVITCDSRRMPSGLLLPLSSNSVQNERFRAQLDASLPLKKQLWRQTMKAKIENQAAILSKYTKTEVRCMRRWVDSVKSGDSDNLEARAAAYYWKNLFSEIHGFENFTRDVDGSSPNALLNYGYAILRAVIARALVSSGLLPTLGIHHHNRYNAYCLADDIMEPYRPYVDELVMKMVLANPNADFENLKFFKKELLKTPVLDVTIDGRKSPLMIAASLTTASLYRCFSGESRKILYPEI